MSETTTVTTDGILFTYREGTSDIKAIEEACGKINKTTKSSYFRTRNDPVFIVQQNDVWLDLGGHIGSFTLRALKDNAKHVYAVEPHPANAALWTTNVQKNNYESRADLLCGAIVSSSGSSSLGCILHETTSTYRHTLLKPTTKFTGHSMEVKTFTLDGIIAQYPSINAVKADIEGSERDVFLSADLFCSGIFKIVLEYSFDHHPCMADFFAFCEAIERKGFTAYFKPSLRNVGDMWDKTVSRGNNGGLVWFTRRIECISKCVQFTAEDAGYFYSLYTINRDDKLSDTIYNAQMKEDEHWKVIENDTYIMDAVTKQPLLILLKGRIHEKVASDAANALRSSAEHCGNNNRGVAGGRIDIDRIRANHRPNFQAGKISPFSVYPLKQDGTISNSHFGNPSDSAIVGWTDVALRDKKEERCRLTQWTVKNQSKYESTFPYFNAVSDCFRRLLYDRWLIQSKAVETTGARVGESVFSSITVNYAWRSATHQDRGDYKDGMGVLCVVNTGGGGEMLFPEYRVGARFGAGDILFFNPHIWHCTAPIESKNERITFVSYFRERLLKTAVKRTREEDDEE